jgi:hypothetical protein
MYYRNTITYRGLNFYVVLANTMSYYLLLSKLKLFVSFAKNNYVCHLR